MDKKNSVISKIFEIMKTVDRIPKNGYNSFHKYKYAMESDVSEHIRTQFVNHKLIAIPNAGGVNTQGELTNVDMKIIVYDVDTGDSIDVVWAGQGSDKGDKGLYKAFTGGLKYWMMKTFMIPTGDDPEADESVDQRAVPVNLAERPRLPIKPDIFDDSALKKQAIQAINKCKNLPELDKAEQRVRDYLSTGDLLQTTADELLSLIKEKAGKYGK